MEATLPVVEITVKHEPMDSDNTEGDEQNGNNKISIEIKEEELWIKPEPHEDSSQDLTIKEDDLGTQSETETRVDEEALNDEYNRNRQSNAPSRKQILVFLDFLNEHRDLANCMLRGHSGRVRANQLWEAIAERLNSISGCIKTTQQWQRVWSDKKYLTRKAAAARYASLAAGGVYAPDLTLQDEKILAIIGEPILPRRVGPKTSLAVGGVFAPDLTLQDEKILTVIGDTPEPKLQTPKQLHDVPVVSVPAKVELEPPSPVVPTEKLTPHPEIQILPNKPPRKPYTPRKTDSSQKEESRNSNIPQPVVPATTVIEPDVSHQPDASKPPDEPPKPGDQKLDDLSSSASITDPPSPNPIQRGKKLQGRGRLLAGLDPYTKKLIQIEEQRLKNDLKRNEQLIGIKNALEEMVGLAKEFIEKKYDKK